MRQYDRFQNRLTGAPVDRPPNFDIMMQFAAHYIKKPLRAYYQDYRVLVEANVAMVEDFELDIVQAISDPYREAADLGLQVVFPDDALPLSNTPLIQQPGDLAALKPVPPEHGKRMHDRLQAIRLFRERVGGKVPIMGWVEGALAEAADLRGVSTLMMDLFERPEWVVELLEFCCQQALAFAEAQVKAGADIIGLGDAVASQVSPEWYRTYALPYEKRIFDEVKSAGGVARLHICGDTTLILDDMANSGADIIDLDWMVDYAQAAKLYGDNGPALCGNFDPVKIMLQGTPDEVKEAVTYCLDVGGAKNFSCAGCEIPDGTPHANLQAQRDVLREYKSAK
ncbi:uroporphyrinogen decarboxylase family protein [candidate division KSB1 bacterium]|nr:uroporphyrinogen decarboxylase family protein [candidate division KSB1 bacterium]